MITEKIYLKEITDQPVGEGAYLEIYLKMPNPELKISKLPAMIVVPGGGYEFVSFREGEPIALRYCAEGFNCFVLTYSVNKPYPLPQLELAVAFKYVFDNAERFNVDSRKISVIGFSAGGHLAGSYGLLYKEFEPILNVNSEDLRPFSLTLSYPVTCFTHDTHAATKRIITDNHDEKLINKLTIPENVTSDYPPTFLWTTKTDDCVPCEQTELLEKALIKNNVKHKVIYYEKGWHGGSLNNYAVFNDDINISCMLANRSWIDEDVDFIYSL